MFPKLLGDFTLIAFFLTFYFEIITDSQEVAKIVQRDPCVYCTQFPRLVTFYITIVQYQNHKTDIGINMYTVL